MYRWNDSSATPRRPKKMQRDPDVQLPRGRLGSLQQVVSAQMELDGDEDPPSAPLMAAMILLDEFDGLFESLKALAFIPMKALEPCEKRAAHQYLGKPPNPKSMLR
jgi:hypothetical protein